MNKHDNPDPCSERVPDTAAPVSALHCQRAKIKLAAGDSRSSAKVAVCQDEFERLAPKPCKTIRV